MFKGSVVVKRIHLLNMIENQKYIFRSPLTKDDSKWHAWGRQISYETLLENDISNYDWDVFMQDAFLTRPENMRSGLQWLFLVDKKR